MFRRVFIESNYDYVPYICFALIAGVFTIVVLRALLMTKSKVQHLASMPLQDDRALLNDHTTTTSESDKASQ